MKKTINIPKLTVEVHSNYWLDKHHSTETYILYVNDQLHCTYSDKEGLYAAIDMLIKSEIGVF